MKNWSSNVTSLTLDNVNGLLNISPCLFIKALHDVEFSSLKNLCASSICIRNINYCIFQTKTFKSTHQLANVMKLMNNNGRLINRINNICFSTIIYSQDNDDSDTYYFEQICDILRQWIANGNKNILILIKLAMCLCL